MNQYDYGARIYDPRIGRFLSVDPLTKSYAMLTPYQFASNRPIDGIDLDGKEWKKIVTYDPKTGITNIHFQVKIKLLNCSQYAGDVSKIGDEFTKQFAAAFEGVYDARRKISYSASAEYEVVNEDLTDSDFGVELYDAVRAKGAKAFIGGLTIDVNTLQNMVSAAGTVANEGEEGFTQRKASNIASTMTHELIHTANVVHPMDPENTAEDVDLKPATFRGVGDKLKPTYVRSTGADMAKILSNIMIYTITQLNGSTVGQIIKDPSKLNKVSPDQAYIIQKQITDDQNKEKPKAATNGNK